MKDWRYKSAQDLGMGERERLGSARRETGLFAHLVQRVANTLVRRALAAYNGLRIEGLERLPDAPPMLLCANHTSHLDALILASVLPSRLRGSTYVISAGDVFFTKIHRAIFTTMMLNTLPISRSGAGRHALRLMRTRLVDEPCNYILFPEGKRSRDGELHAFKPGIGMLCAGSPCAVVPCWIEGAFASLPPFAKLPKPSHICVRFGEPASYEDRPNTKRGWIEIGEDLEQRIGSLRPV